MISCDLSARVHFFRLAVLAFCAMAAAIPSVARASSDEIVLYAGDASVVQGAWAARSSTSGAGGRTMHHADNGWSTTDTALASPGNYFEVKFDAPAGTTYRVWLRMRASGDSKWNDSVWVQFSDALDTNGTAAYRIGTTSGLAVNLERCAGCGVASWGWQNGAYWLSQPTQLRFATSGTHTLRVQTREDGVEIDQIVLSSSTYASSAPGQPTHDTVILSKTGSTSNISSAVSLPGSIEAAHFDNGPSGVSYYDTTPGNAGGQLRSGDVDIEASSDGGYNIGWTSAGEWLNYTANVTTAGQYTVQLRVASTSGGSIQVGFNGPSSVWSPVTVPNTSGWQSWTTVSLPVTLGAGLQQMTLLFNTGGVNLRSISVTAGQASTSSTTSTSSTSSTGRGGTFRMMTWNIHHGRTRSGSYDPAGQARFIASHNPHVVVLQEVQTWDENQPAKYKSLLEQLTGVSWHLQWAPVTSSSGTEGNVVLTRLPVSSSTYHQMHATGDWSALYSNRSVAQTTVSVGDVPVHVFSTHLDYANTTYRTAQLLDLMAWTQNFSGQQVVGGDFNSWWGEYWITTMMGDYYDTWQDVTGSNQNGYTVNDAVRFDYLFRAKIGSDKITPTNVYVPWTSMSDHHPVIADYKVTP